MKKQENFKIIFNNKTTKEINCDEISYFDIKGNFLIVKLYVGKYLVFPLSKIKSFEKERT